MVFVVDKREALDDVWWKSILKKQKAEDMQTKSGNCSPSGWDVPVELRQWRNFEFADALEQGLGPGLTSTFVEPPPAEEEKDRRLIVKCENERKEWILESAEGEPLLKAVGLADGFDLFATNDSKALGPAFTLRSNAKQDSWTLSSVRCERCESRGTRLCGTRELARMSHYCETVGDGNAFCMDVEMPELLEDGSSSVMCSVCSDPDEAIGGSVLTSKRPKWNQRQKTLTLDFRGRCSMASAKNFQLEAENDPSKVTLLFGKVGANKFVLDYCNPLGTVQAFATALTATHW
eukprot:CAMPEP_0197650000 /NCGR_PEP_ID=MMETSP1338-20131121/30683_1 /TAXON_ID=43686 ORGANISM="Pelagodinium beii, Strain RCC1491" /NCGR_SAMPLE_ID=MMETSP1338 /ASSEMBLY_ACC=CAM_ASM_000754 /LENGTH=290 /DNA_ID=CAMNT_0043224333 /DNA_START=51 /DNA_END=920 /DNA_ORIENTATION=+